MLRLILRRFCAIFSNLDAFIFFSRIRLGSLDADPIDSDKLSLISLLVLDQGSQTHLSMWAAVEGNSQSAGRTTKCNFLRNTVLTAVES